MLAPVAAAAPRTVPDDPFRGTPVPLRGRFEAAAGAACAATWPPSAHLWQVTEATCQATANISEARRSCRDDTGIPEHLHEQILKNSKCQMVVLDSRKLRNSA